MADQPVFLFLGVYGDPAVAREDLEVVRDLHASGVIGTYDAAIAVKTPTAPSTWTSGRSRPSMALGGASAPAPWSASSSRRRSSAQRPWAA